MIIDLAYSHPALTNSQIVQIQYTAGVHRKAMESIATIYHPQD
jgi:hypothetical protein